jgi:uncharacterized membrane protein
MRLKTIAYWAFIAAMGIGFSIASIIITLKSIPIDATPGLKEGATLALCAFTVGISILNITIVLKSNLKKKEAAMRKTHERHEKDLHKIEADVIHNILMEPAE